MQPLWGCVRVQQINSSTDMEPLRGFLHGTKGNSISNVAKKCMEAIVTNTFTIFIEKFTGGHLPTLLLVETSHYGVSTHNIWHLYRNHAQCCYRDVSLNPSGVSYL